MMKPTEIAVILCVYIFTSFEAFAGGGPTSLGSISMGMSKAEYVSAIGITPLDCNTYIDSDGKPKRSEMKYLTLKNRTLCWVALVKDKTASIENIQVGGLSYDVIETNLNSSEFIETVGHSSKAIFLKDRLISLEIYAPKVSLETLTAKYGAPKFADNRKTEICRNKIGNEIKNSIGNLDTVWVNGEVRSILRIINSSPRKTCTDGLDLQYYILEEPRQVKLIEDAINKHLEDISLNSAKDSPF